MSRALKNFKKLQGLSDKTISNYQYGFGKVKEIIGRTRITTYNKVIKLINETTEDPATRGNYYTSIIKYMELQYPDLKPTTDPSNQKEKAYVAYKQEGTKWKKVYNEAPKKVPENIKELNIIELKKKYIKYIKDSNYKITNGELLLGFYILQPPRRLDYESLIYKDTTKVPKDQQHNYYLKNGKVVFNQYSKTKETYGQQIVIINNIPLRQLLRKQKYEDNQTIFSQSKRTIQRKLQQSTQKIFGQEINVRELRVLHNTDKYGKLKEDIKEMEQDAYNMGHSAKTKMSVYVRDKN